MKETCTMNVSNTVAHRVSIRHNNYRQAMIVMPTFTDDSRSYWRLLHKWGYDKGPRWVSVDNGTSPSLVQLAVLLSSVSPIIRPKVGSISKKCYIMQKTASLCLFSVWKFHTSYSCLLRLAIMIFVHFERPDQSE